MHSAAASRVEVIAGFTVSTAAIGTLVVGIAGVLAFGPAFELFHQLLFPAGSYIFDPATDRLVQLFPERFWIDSTLGAGTSVHVYLPVAPDQLR